MEKEFVSYEQAVALKELGFGEDCLASYYHAGKRLSICGDYIKHGKYTVLAPLKQQVFRWFRDNYDLFVVIDYDVRSHIRNKEGKLLYEHCKDRKYAGFVYEEAENDCIDKLIELAKQQSK